MPTRLSSLLGFSSAENWEKSPAHLLLLSKFVRPQVFEEFAKEKDWDVVLGQPVQKAIRRFVEDGALISAGLAEGLGSRFKAADLRDMLKQRGLPVSGRKADMIARLIEADPGGMKQALVGLTVLQCSERGQEIVRQYLVAEKERLAAAQQGVLAMLQRGKFRQASLLVASYEAGQVFQRGFNIDWKRHDPSSDVAVLKSIFGGRPKVLVSLDRGKLGPLRLAAGMMHLWSLSRMQVEAWLPSGFETGLAVDASTAASMLLSYGLQQAELQQYRKTAKATGFAISVSIRTNNDDGVCPACRALARRHYKLSEVPALPYEKCTSEGGCRCWMTAAIE
jgi:hypothetical protein